MNASARARALATIWCGVRRELRPECLGKCNGLGSHHVGQRATQHERAAPVDVLRELVGAQDQAAPRPAQGLVSRRRHDMGVRDRVELTLQNLPRDKAGEMGHVDHQDRADAVGDLAHPGVIDVARVSAEAGQQDQGLDLEGLFLDRVVVEQERLAIDGIAMRLEHLAGGVEPVAMGQMAPRGQIEPQAAADCRAPGGRRSIA